MLICPLSGVGKLPDIGVCRAPDGPSAPLSALLEIPNSSILFRASRSLTASSLFSFFPNQNTHKNSRSFQSNHYFDHTVVNHQIFNCNQITTQRDHFHTEN